MSFGPEKCVLYNKPHDIVIHIVAVSDMEIACRMFVEAHVFVEADSRVVAVYIQFDGKRTGMDRFQVSDALLDDVTADACSVQGGQRVYFLKFIQILLNRFDGQVARRDAVGIDDEELMVKFVHLLEKIFMTVHHVEHIVQLFAGQDGTIGRLPDFRCQILN